MGNSTGIYLIEDIPQITLELIQRLTLSFIIGKIFQPSDKHTVILKIDEFYFFHLNHQRTLFPDRLELLL